MQLLSDIQKVIFDWAVAQSGLLPAIPDPSLVIAIWADQDGPRIPKPYILLNTITGITPTSVNSEQIMPEADGNSVTRIMLLHGQMTLSINVFADTYPESHTIIQTLIGSLLSENVRDSLKRRYKSTVEVTTVENDETYAVTINGEEIEITSDSSATDLEIRDALVIAINASTFITVVVWDVDPITLVALPDNELIIQDLPGIEYKIEVSSRLTITEEIKSVNLSYITNLGVTNLTELLDTKFEGRAQVDIVFAAPLQTFDDPGIIESVEITNNMNNEVITIP